ncbi:sugar transferase [Tabrizicola sp. KVB23]|uniref:Sugar transferase n=2 Tax=Fuscibacter oryzae TaxID=2803939 RepID=A0A8J7MPW4_9RHOB|nr:sugar transferase [Fuscibacter oryzae]
MTATFPEFGTPSSSSVAVRSATALRMVGRPGLYRNAVKRLLDVAAVAMAVPVVVPVVLAVAIAVSRDGGSPFYSQMRVGKNGKRFRMWKLRSMVPDADGRMAAHLEADPEARKEWELTQKLKNDPRITRIGRLIRKTSMDELPQLWNVLKGDMSLVGPRPMMTCQEALYPGTAYYLLRPGCTGYWQTSARNETTFEARAEFDAAYEADLSLWTDLKVLAKTVGVILRGTGC